MTYDKSRTCQLGVLSNEQTYVWVLTTGLSRWNVTITIHVHLLLSPWFAMFVTWLQAPY